MVSNQDGFLVSCVPTVDTCAVDSPEIRTRTGPAGYFTPEIRTLYFTLEIRQSGSFRESQYNYKCMLVIPFLKMRTLH